MMELDLDLQQRSGESVAKVYEVAGGYAPTIGIIGAVLGLIQVMKHLENIEEVGRGIAVAFVATVYGVASANLFFLPAANKIKARLHETLHIKELMLEGVCSIVEGMNPKLIRIKLSAFAEGEAAGAAEGQRSARGARGGRARIIAWPGNTGLPSTKITNAGWYPTPISSRCCLPSSS